MEDKSRSELITEAERELAETKGLVDEQYAIVTRLKRIGAEQQAGNPLANRFARIAANARATPRLSANAAGKPSSIKTIRFDLPEANVAWHVDVGEPH
jgi:hypothetical protein